MSFLTWKRCVRTFLFSTLTVFSSGILLAQEKKDDDKKKDQSSIEERMVVTGSRIRRTDAETASPVTVVTRETIEQTGATSIAKILQELPAMVGGVQNTNISNGNDDRSTLRLRGLPESNTLILLNGRRLVQHGFPGGVDAESSVDLNTIPLQVVERIEVLKDGSSAVYGSDAVAGVVNIITRKDFTGFEVPLYFGQTTRGDMATQNYSFVYGTEHDRGNIMISANYYEHGVIWSRDRAISANADARGLGGADERSSAPPNGRFTVPGVGTYTYDPSLGDGSSLDHFVPYDFNQHGYNFSQETPAVIPQERANIFFQGNWDLSDNVNFFVEAQYVNIKTENALAPTPIFTAFESVPVTISAENRYNPFGVDITDARRRMLELGNRVANYEGDNYRFLGGVEGEFGEGWNWETNFLWHRDKRSNYQTGAMVLSRVQMALGPDDVCQADPNCVPLNLFGGPGSITPEMINYVSTVGQFSGSSSLKSLSGNVTGNLGWLQGGPIGLAVGAEYREEVGEDNPDSLTSQGNTIGFSNFEPTYGERDITEFYAEVNLPFLSGKRGIELLELNVAARHSDYSDFGTTTNPKFSLRYQPIKRLMLRATMSEAFKAPTIGQLFSGESESHPTLSDPLQPAEDERVQFLTVKGGNAALKAEESDVFTFGLVSEPFENFSFTLDYYDIDQTNVVEANAQFILDENARTGLFADRVIRDERGFLVRLIATPINVGRREVRGYDWSFNYRRPETNSGNWNFTLAGSYVDDWMQQTDPTVDFVQRAGTFDGNDGPGSIPRVRGRFITNWRMNGLNLSGTVNYVGDYDESDNGINRTVEAWTTIDLQGTYNWNRGLAVTLGVDNLTDEDPPFSVESFNDNYDGSIHNLYGAFWYMRVTQRF